MSAYAYVYIYIYIIYMYTYVMLAYIHTYIHIYIYVCTYVQDVCFLWGGVIKLRVCEGLGSIVFGLEGLIIGGYPVWTDDPSQLPFC